MNDYFYECLSLFKKYKSLRNFLSELLEKNSDSLEDGIKQDLLACLKKKDLVLELDKIFFKKKRRTSIKKNYSALHSSIKSIENTDLKK